MLGIARLNGVALSKSSMFLGGYFIRDRQLTGFAHAAITEAICI